MLLLSLRFLSNNGVKESIFQKDFFSIYGSVSSSKQQNEIGLCYLSPHKETIHTKKGDNSCLDFISFIKYIVQVCKILGTHYAYALGTATLRDIRLFIFMRIKKKESLCCSSVLTFPGKR